jgi:hypothetical protein
MIEGEEVRIGGCKSECCFGVEMGVKYHKEEAPRMYSWLMVFDI